MGDSASLLSPAAAAAAAAAKTMSIQQQLAPLACNGGRCGADVSLSGPLPVYPRPDPGSVGNVGSGCSYGVDESFPPLPDHLVEHHADPSFSFISPPQSQTATRKSVTLEEGATLVYCSADQAIYSKHSPVVADAGSGSDGHGRMSAVSGGVTDRSYESHGAKEGIRRITDKYAAPETLSLLWNGTAGDSIPFADSSDTAALSSAASHQHVSLASSSVAQLSPHTSSAGLPYSASVYPLVSAAAAGNSRHTLTSSTTPSVTLPASSSFPSFSSPSSSPSPSCVLPAQNVTSTLLSSTVGLGAVMNGGGSCGECSLEMRPERRIMCTTGHNGPNLADAGGVDQSTMSGSASASAEFRQSLNFRLSQKQGKPPNQAGLVKAESNHQVTDHVTGQKHVTGQNHVTVSVDSRKIPIPSSSSPTQGHAVETHRASMRHNGPGLSEGVISRGGVSPLSIPVPPFSDASSDMSDDVMSDASPASPALTVDSGGFACSPVGGLIHGGGGRGYLPSVGGLSLGSVSVGSGGGLPEGVTDTEVQQVEMFYKSHKAEVTVCRSLVNLYIGSAAPAATITSTLNSTSSVTNGPSPVHAPCTAENGPSAVTAGPASSGSDTWEFITTGIPVLVLDSGEHVRARQLSVLIAEKGTGFCLWRDVVSHLTRYTCPHANFHTLRVSTDTRKLAGLSFDDGQAAAEFSATVQRLTADHDDELLLLSKTGKGKKKKSVKLTEKKKSKYKAPKKTDISQPCYFQHVTKLERPQIVVGGALLLPPGSFPPAPSLSVSSLSDVFHDRMSLTASRAKSASSELSEGSVGTGISSEH